MVSRVGLACLATVLCFPFISTAQLRAEIVGTGFTNPVAILADPVAPGVSFVVEQAGIVRVMRDGQVLATPFVDLRSAVLSGGERGLLGMAFPPDAASSGRVFFNFTDRNGDTVVARFKRSPGNPLAIDASTRFDLRWPSGERVIRQPFPNHNGGNLVFGPDGYLYIGLGDGGSARDPQNNAQNPLALLGKMLRIDVNVADSDLNGYRIPGDNPFLDSDPIFALPEIWAFGLRNPWRYSFDDVGADATGALIIADVGQNAREEIDYEPSGSGGRNYGWRIREARIQTPGVPPTTPAYGPLTDPIYDYTQNDGRAVTGGFVYRGTRLSPAYRGRYFFADFVSARVWSMGLAITPSTREATAIDVIEHTAELGGSVALGGISTFGRDPQGELHLASFSGRIIRIGPDATPPNVPRDLRAVVSGSRVVVSWNAPSEGPVPAQYRLEAGSMPGAADRGVALLSGSLNSVTFDGVPAGTHHVRLRSVAASGVSAATPDVIVTVGGGCTAAPPAPFGLAAIVNGRAVRLVWDEPDTPNGPASFIIEAGSGAGSANLAVITVDAALRSLVVTAPPGTYFVRVRARNACGMSDASNEIVISVH